MIKVDQEKAYRSLKSGKRKEQLLLAGVPATLHDLKYDKRELPDTGPGIIFVARTSGPAMQAGAEVVMQLTDSRVSAALIGFSKLLDTYKNSFREVEAKALLRDRFTYYKWLIFSHVTESAIANWELKYLSWFRGIIGTRLANGLKIGLCIDATVTDKVLNYVMGDLSDKLPSFLRIVIGD